MMDHSQSMAKMWSGLQSKHSRGPGRSALMISCEAELQDLMRELDIMVRKKESQWEDRFNMLQTDLDMKSNELRIAQDTLEHRNREISQLRFSVQNLDKDNANKLSKYEGEVTELRKQLINLKRCYEKLQKKHRRDYSKLEQDTSKSETALQDSMSEVQRLTEKIEEYKTKARDWGTQRMSYQTQISNLESQRKTLADKCELIKHQSHLYKTQINNRKDLLDSTEITLRAQVTQLEGQIQRDKDTMNYQEEKIRQLKKQLEESQASLRQTRSIKERIHEELEEVSANKGRCEDETSNLCRELKYYKDSFRTTKQRGDEIERQMVELKQKLRDKTSQLNKVEEVNALQESEQVRKLLTDLQNVQMNNFSLQEQQKTLQSDVERMTEQVARSESEVCRLSEALRRKEDGRNTDARDARQYEAEVCRLRAKTESMEDSHDSQIEGMKVQMSNLTEELHQRNTAFANLTDKLAHTENQYKQEVMKHQKDVGDFELTKAQLDALRHENKHLKQTVLSQSETANDVKKFEGMLRKLEKEYNHAVEKLQIENRKLKQDLDEMMMDRSPACQRRSYGMGSASRSRQKNNSSQWEDHQDLIPSFNDETSHTYQFNNSASKPAYTELLQSPPRSRAPHTEDFTKTYQLNNNASVPGYTDAQQSTAQSHATRTEDLPGSLRFSGQFNNNNANILNQGASPQSSQHSLITGIGNLSQSQGSVDKSNLFLEGLPSPQRSPAAAKEYVSSLLPPSMPANGKDIFSQSNPSTSFSSSLGFEQQVVPPIRDGSGGGTEMWHLNMSTDRPSSRASISGQFLAEEQQRSNDLQRNIDILIEDFEMNNTTRSPDRL